jgi:tetratricopeptide (TPR) repeat protein
MKPFTFSFIFVSLSFHLMVNAQTEQEILTKIETAIKTNDTLEITRAWYALAKFYDNENLIDKSNTALHQTLSHALSIKNYKAHASAANYLASNLSQQGEKDSAIYYYNMAIDDFIACNDSLKMASVLINLSDEYASSGNFIEAANHALMAVKIKETVKDSANLAYFYQKVGEIYKQADENDKWETYVLKGYRLIHNEEYADIRAKAAIYNDLGGIAETRGQYNLALQYYDTLIQIGRNNNYNNALGVALNNSAIIYKLMGNPEKALESALKAREFKKQSTYQKLTEFNLLAELYLETGNLAEARKHAEIALSDENSTSFPEERIRTLKIISQIEKYSRNFEQALLYFEQYKSLSDSLRDKEIRTRIIDLEIAYETEKKENQIELLTTENELKNQRLRAGLILLVVLVVIIFMVLYILQIRRKQASLVQNDLQQQVLRSQMNPHFIFNVLGSIQQFMLQNNINKASDYLSRFARLTRSILDFSSAETISLTDELSMLRNYIELEQMRNPQKFSFVIKTDENLESDFIQIPPMLIQPFVENAIKHGFKNLEQGGKLNISVTEDTESVDFVIEDNGTGLSANESQPAGHISAALQIFEKRRKLITQKYKKEVTFEMTDIKQKNPDLSGVRITVKIPILKND